ncbi:hypothetical protein TNCV_731631 [Trichonephila clavipes]|nr:hypothetical protein TNCV_731631 [Trichonephila clavipes]
MTVGESLRRKKGDMMDKVSRCADELFGPGAFKKDQNGGLQSAKKLPADLEDKLVQFQRHVIGLKTRHAYEFMTIGNADEPPCTFTCRGKLGCKFKRRERGENSEHRITVCYCTHTAINYLLTEFSTEN